MQDTFWKKGFVYGIIIMFVGTGFITSISATFPSDFTIITSIQLVINNDGSGDPTDKFVDVPAYILDSGITPALTINFMIIGVNNGTIAYYGDDPGEDWKNISVNGDILYPVDTVTLYHVGTKGDWNCCITPTQGIGKISIGIDWSGYGSAIESIQISKGTFVLPQILSFPWGQDCNLTFLVKDIDSEAVKNAKMYLIWEEDDHEFYKTVGTNTVGNGANGEYSIWITKEDQGDFVPKNITIAVEGIIGFWGYTKVSMRTHNNHPDIPSISGEINGIIQTSYTYFIQTNDPDNDSVFYYIDWGDNTDSGWIGSYNIGQIVNICHSWSSEGTYSIKVLAKDIYGLESDWATLTVTMPYKFNLLQQFFNFLFERFPNAFPILRQLRVY